MRSHALGQYLFLREDGRKLDDPSYFGGIGAIIAKVLFWLNPTRSVNTFSTSGPAEPSRTHPSPTSGQVNLADRAGLR